MLLRFTLVSFSTIMLYRVNLSPIDLIGLLFDWYSRGLSRSNLDHHPPPEEADDDDYLPQPLLHDLQEAVSTYNRYVQKVSNILFCSFEAIQEPFLS